MGAPFNPISSQAVNYYDACHITMTYTAIVQLLILGDELEQVDRVAILESLAVLQQENGSFASTIFSLETDIRFLYCACCICYILDGWTFINTSNAIRYISSCQSYDGAFGQKEHQESHGGSTYCAVASLWLMGKLDALCEREKLIEWLLFRQNKGFHGRINKDDDTCYAFWIGSSLEMLDAYKYIAKEPLLQFLETTHTPYGGFGKCENSFPDMMHSYLGLSGLAIAGEPTLRSLFVPLGISNQVHDAGVAKGLMKNISQGTSFH